MFALRPLAIAWKELIQLRRDRLTLAHGAGAAAHAAAAVRLRHQHRRAAHPDAGARPGRQRRLARSGAQPGGDRLLRPGRAACAATRRSTAPCAASTRQGGAGRAAALRLGPAARAAPPPSSSWSTAPIPRPWPAPPTPPPRWPPPARRSWLAPRARIVGRAVADLARAQHLVQPRAAHGGVRRARAGRRDPDHDHGHAHRHGHRARARARHAGAADRLAGGQARADRGQDLALRGHRLRADDG